MISEQSLAWMRSLHGDVEGASGDGGASRELAEMASRTPAWIEPFVALVERRRALDSDVVVELVTPPCPQIVDVDFPTMAFTRAEWVDGNLYLRMAPLYEDPKVFTSFRIVGAEPRNWDVHGIDGVSLDLTSTALNVRVPLVAGDLELFRSSY